MCYDKMLAYYQFDSSPNDSIGRSGPFALKNTQYSDNGLYLNGIYLVPKTEGEGYESISFIEDLDYEEFSVRLKFYSLGFDDTNRNWDSDKCNILVGGTAYRWFALRRNEDSNLELTLNNQEFRSVFRNAEIDAKKWHEIICSVDIRNRVINTMLDGSELGKIHLPVNFTLEVLGSKFEDSDKEFTFTNYGCNTVFYGYIKYLQIFGKALFLDEMRAIYRQK